MSQTTQIPLPSPLILRSTFLITAMMISIMIVTRKEYRSAALSNVWHAQVQVMGNLPVIPLDVEALIPIASSEQVLPLAGVDFARQESILVSEGLHVSMGGAANHS